MMSFKIFSFNDWLSEGGSAPLRSFSLNSSYERMCWVYACVNRIATSASSAPLVFYEGKPDRIPLSSPNEKERIKDREHPVYQLFNPPKPPTIISLKQLMHRTFVHESLDGLIFWVIERKKGVATSIDLRLKTELRPVLEQKGNEIRQILRGWEDSSGKRYLPEDVLPIDSYNPKNPLTGLSRLNPARLSLESEFNIAGWNSAFFRSGMKNPLLIQAKGQLNPTQKKEIRSEVVNYYSGIDGAHGALLMSGSVEVKPLVVNPKDVDFIRGKELNREEILAVYGVPPAIVGIFSYANYCCTCNTRVTLKDNKTVFINQVNPGDVIISMGDMEITEATVLNTVSVGVKTVCNLITRCREISCSLEHEFYTYSSTTKQIEWKKAKELTLDDWVAIVVKPLEVYGELAPNGFPLTEEFMHQLGMYVGDGNISSSNGYQMGVCIGRPETDPNREDYINEARAVWPAKKVTKENSGLATVIKDKRCYRVCSVRAAELINELGFSGISKTKRLPQWVFGLKHNLRRALLQGILDTDGCYRGGKTGAYELGMSNENLVYDIRNLIITLGLHVTKVRYSYKMSNYGPNPLWKINLHTLRGYYGQTKGAELASLPEGLRWDKVKQINIEDEAEMYDLEIEGTHNYFANWMVTHNSNVREQIRIFWEHTLLPKMNHILELVQFNILDRDFPGVYAAWDLSKVAGLAPDPVEIAAPAQQYMNMGYSPSQTARILQTPVLEPDKDFKKPEPKPVQDPNANNPQQDPKNPPKDPNAGDPKPSDKPKPDNNNSYVRERLISKIKIFAECSPLNHTKLILPLWNDLITPLIRELDTQIDLTLFEGFATLLCECPTEEMRRQVIERKTIIADFIINSIYNLNSRV